MKSTLVRFALPAFCVLAVQLHGQSAAPAPAVPSYSQSLTYVKTTPGNGTAWLQLVRDTSLKAAQIRADAGEILSWTLLRSVLPSGQEARADYVISVLYDGAPRAPLTRTATTANFKKAGVAMSSDDYYTKRAALGTIVATELWRVRERVAAPQKGHYLYLNFMRVHDAAAYYEFENKVWRPLAAEWVKQGAMSGWIFATKILPSGTDTVYSAYSADIFPTWEAAFKVRSIQEAFAKAHPAKNYQETMGTFTKMRDLAKRELWEVVERVEKSK